METELPLKRSSSLTEIFSVSVDKELKELITNLKLTTKYDVPELVRMILKRELGKVAQQGNV